VLFFGVPASVEIRQSEDDNLRIEGSRASLGLSDDEARASAESIRVRIDRVDDFLESGPHEGEIFRGTNSSKERKPEAQAGSWADNWGIFRDRIGERAGMLRSNDAFPHLADGFTPWHDDLPAALRNAVRVSVGREKMEALTIPRGLHSDGLASLLQVNYTGDQWVQGPVGRADVTVYLPQGRRLTVVNGGRLSLSGLTADVFLVGGSSCEVEDMRGALHLVNTPLDKATRLRGALWQRFHGFGGVDYAGERARRQVEYGCEVREVAGNIDIDVGKVDIDGSGLMGNVRIRNRHGRTSVRVPRDLGEGRVRVDSVSGSVSIALDDPYNLSVAAATVARAPWTAAASSRISIFAKIRALRSDLVDRLALTPAPRTPSVGQPRAGPSSLDCDAPSCRSGDRPGRIPEESTRRRARRRRYHRSDGGRQWRSSSASTLI
jgi:hypothetical protein